MVQPVNMSELIIVVLMEGMNNHTSAHIVDKRIVQCQKHILCAFVSRPPPSSIFLHKENS